MECVIGVDKRTRPNRGKHPPPMTHREKWRGGGLKTLIPGGFESDTKRNENMIEYMIIAGVMALLGATKRTKKPVFGQLTLTGEKAVDWVKPDSTITALKIWFCTPGAVDDYNLPEWAKEKGIVALIFPVTEWGNPMLVTQKSILKILEAKCAEWESNGSAVNVLKVELGTVHEILFEENHPVLTFVRPKNAKQFDPYKVAIE